MEKRIKAIGLLMVILMGGMGWFLTQYMENAPQWALSVSNPHIYEGRNLSWGYATDRNGICLLDGRKGRVYSEDERLRLACVHWTGDSHGRVDAGILNRYAGMTVRYDTIAGLGSDGQAVVELTLDAGLQKAAYEALAGRRGCVAVCNYQTGQLLCAVSSPSFDPAQNGSVEAGANVNRFLQGTYVPGSVFKLVTAGAVLTYAPELAHRQFYCGGRVDYDDSPVTCPSAHGRLDLNGAVERSCNCVFAQITQHLGKTSLRRFVQRCGVTGFVELDGIQSKAGNFDIDEVSAGALAWAGIGQHTDQVNPATFLSFVSAIAGGEDAPPLYIVERISCSGETVYWGGGAEKRCVLTKSVASALKTVMKQAVQRNYGAEKFGKFPVCAKTGTAQLGGGKQPNAMLVGFVDSEECPLAFFAAVEESGSGASVCIPVIAQVLKCWE